MGSQTENVGNAPPSVRAEPADQLRSKDDLEEQRIALEWARLRSERQKSALEFRLKRWELADRKGKGWIDLIANPLTLAIVGGFITLMTTIVSNHFTVSANLAVEATKADLAAKAENNKAALAAKAANQTLQADLIKKFVEGSKTSVRENLSFLVQAGLLPEYEDNIKAYLKNNPDTAPNIASQALGFDTGKKLIDLTYFVAGMEITTDGICSDPAPCKRDSSHQNETSLRHPDTMQSLDPITIPYINLPLFKTKEAQISLGDLAAVYNTKTKKLAFAIFGDNDPPNHLGTGSVALAKELGLSGDPRISVLDSIVYIVFPKSRVDSHITPELINTEGKKLFDRWGGDKELQRRLQSSPDNSSAVEI